MDIRDRLLTIEEYLEFTRQPENENRWFELVGGRLVEWPPAPFTNSVVAARIGAELVRAVDDQKPGYVTGADGGYQLGPDEVRIPDAAYITKDRAGTLTSDLFHAAPDIAVEVIPSDLSYQVMMEKVRAYLRAGTQQVWVVWPDEKAVDVYQQGAEETLHIQTLHAGQVLKPEDILPGFALNIAELFPV